MTFLFFFFTTYLTRDSCFEGIIRYEVKKTSLSEAGIKEHLDTVTYYITKNRIKLITNRKAKMRNQEIEYVIFDYLTGRYQTYLSNDNLVLLTKMSESNATIQLQPKEDSMSVLGFTCKKIDIESTSLRFQNNIHSKTTFQTSIWVANNLTFQSANNRFDELFNNSTGCITLYCESENYNHTKSDVNNLKLNVHSKNITRAIEIIPKKLSDNEFTFPTNTKFVGE